MNVQEVNCYLRNEDYELIRIETLDCAQFIINCYLEQSINYDYTAEVWYKMVGGEKKLICKGLIIKHIYDLLKDLLLELDDFYCDKTFCIDNCKMYLELLGNINKLKKNTFINNVYKHMKTLKGVENAQWQEINEIV